MTIIYLDADVAIRNYTATVKGSRSIGHTELLAPPYFGGNEPEGVA